MHFLGLAERSKPVVLGQPIAHNALPFKGGFRWFYAADAGKIVL